VKLTAAVADPAVADGLVCAIITEVLGRYPVHATDPAPLANAVCEVAKILLAAILNTLAVKSAPEAPSDIPIHNAALN
jgi:hypothetical protein